MCVFLLRYYYAVVECDSVATGDYLYKSCDGVEFERSSNVLDLRFIPDSMDFKHPPRDVATEVYVFRDSLLMMGLCIHDNCMYMDIVVRGQICIRCKEICFYRDHSMHKHN